MRQIIYYCKRFKFNNFIISQYGLKYKISKLKTLYLFIKNECFEFIDTHFRIIISLPLDDIMQSLHNKISNLYIGLSNYEHFIESLYNDIGDYLNDSKRSDENS